MHFALNTTIFGDIDLSIVQCCCFLDLVFDESKCVHLSLPEILGVFNPVPSVVCVPIVITFWYIVLNGLDQFYLPLWLQTLMPINPKDYSISI